MKTIIFWLVMTSTAIAQSHKKDCLAEIRQAEIVTAALPPSPERNDALDKLMQAWAIVQSMESPPYSDGIDNVQATVGDADGSVDLNAAFTDLETDQSLVFSIVGNTMPAIFAGLPIQNGILSLQYSDVPGKSVLTVRATDPTGLFGEVSFEVLLRSGAITNLFGQRSFAVIASGPLPTREMSGGTVNERTGEWVGLDQFGLIHHMANDGSYTRSIVLVDHQNRDWEAIEWWETDGASYDEYVLSYEANPGSEKFSELYWVRVPWTAVEVSLAEHTVAYALLPYNGVEAICSSRRADGSNDVHCWTYGSGGPRKHLVATRNADNTVTVQVNPWYDPATKPSSDNYACRGAAFDPRICLNPLRSLGGVDTAQIQELDFSSGDEVSQLIMPISRRKPEDIAMRRAGSGKIQIALFCEGAANGPDLFFVFEEQ